jgi:hypothetical protein
MFSKEEENDGEKSRAIAAHDHQPTLAATEPPEQEKKRKPPPSQQRKKSRRAIAEDILEDNQREIE